MSPELIIAMATTAAQLVAQAIEAIRTSSLLTEEERRHALDTLSMDLDRLKVAVASVRFSDV